VFTTSLLRAAVESSSNVTSKTTGHKAVPQGPLSGVWLSLGHIYIVVFALAVFIFLRLTFSRILPTFDRQEKRKTSGSVWDLPQECERRESFAQHSDCIRKHSESAVAGEALDRPKTQITAANGRSIANTAAKTRPARPSVLSAGALPLWSLLTTAGLRQGRPLLPCDPARRLGLMDDSCQDDGSRGVSKNAAASSSQRSGPESGTKGQAGRHAHSYISHQPPREPTSSSPTPRPLAYDFAALERPSSNSDGQRPVYSAAPAEEGAQPKPPTHQHRRPSQLAHGQQHPAGPDGRSRTFATGNMSRDGSVATQSIAVPSLLPPLSFTTMTSSPVETATAPYDSDLVSSPFSRRRFQRRPPLPPITAPTLATAGYTFEDRRPSYAVSIPPELELDAAATAASANFIHQPNPTDFLDSSSDGHYGHSANYAPQPATPGALSPATAGRQQPSSPGHRPVAAGPRPARRRSYSRAQPVGIPAPAVAYAQEPQMAASEFAPSSYPPASPRLPPPPPGWELDGLDYELYEGTEEEVISPWDGPDGDAVDAGDDSLSPWRAGAGGGGGDGGGTSSRERRRVDVQGEIIASLDADGAGWKRHTRVYGGGVCLACAAAGGHGGSGGGGAGHGAGHGGMFGENVMRDGKR
jgi:hypothetical protein